MSKVKFLLMLVLVLGYGSVIELFYPMLVQVIEYLLILVLLAGKSISLKGRAYKYLLIIYSCCIFSCVFTATSPIRYASFIVRPIVALLILNAYNYDYFSIRSNFKKVLNLVAILALVNFFLTTVAQSLFIPMISDKGYQVNSIGLVFNYVAITERFGFTFTRNQGLFWEPGVLVILMNVYVFILLFEENSKIKNAILPLFIILTTASTSGYLVLAMIIIVWYLKRIKLSRGSIRKRLVTIFSALIIIGAFTPMLIEEITFKATTGVGSTNKRMFDMLMGIEVALDNPLFGIGPEQERYLAIQNKYAIFVGEDGDVSYDARQNSNIFVMLFAFYGIPMAVLFLYGLYRQNVFKHRKLFFVILVIGLFSEPVVFVDLYFLWIMSGSFGAKDGQIVSTFAT